MPDPVDPRIQQAQEAMAAEQYAREVHEIIRQGQDEFGAKQFDQASEDVARAGVDPAMFTAIVRQFDAPAAILMHLASNPDRLAKFAKLSHARQLTEIAAIQSQLSPHGHVNVGADPAWKSPASRERRLGDHGGEHIKDDAAWSKAFDKHWAERAKRRGRY